MKFLFPKSQFTLSLEGKENVHNLFYKNLIGSSSFAVQNSLNIPKEIKYFGKKVGDKIIINRETINISTITPFPMISVCIINKEQFDYIYVKCYYSIEWKVVIGIYYFCCLLIPLISLFWNNTINGFLILFLKALFFGVLLFVLVLFNHQLETKNARIIVNNLLNIISTESNKE